MIAGGKIIQNESDSRTLKQLFITNNSVINVAQKIISEFSIDMVLYGQPQPVKMYFFYYNTILQVKQTIKAVYPNLYIPNCRIANTEKVFEDEK